MYFSCILKSVFYYLIAVLPKRIEFNIIIQKKCFKCLTVGENIAFAKMKNFSNVICNR